MVAYIGAKSYFYDDEALGEQLYNMVCDLKVAEKEGIRAVDFLACCSDPSWHALFNGFYLDDATENRTPDLCCHSTQFLGVQPVHYVALVQTELW